MTSRIAGACVFLAYFAACQAVPIQPTFYPATAIEMRAGMPRIRAHEAKRSKVSQALAFLLSQGFTPSPSQSMILLDAMDSAFVYYQGAMAQTALGNLDWAAYLLDMADAELAKAVLVLEAIIRRNES